MTSSETINFLLSQVGPNLLSPAEASFIDSHPLIANNLKVYLANNQNDAGVEMIHWSINFFMENPDTTWERFENWFLGKPEGSDGGDVFNMDDYTNVQVQSYSSLPSRNDFYNAFPKNGTAGMQNTAVYQLVGGNLYNLRLTYPNKYWNACAIRVSRALNYSNYPIPVFKK